MSRFRVTRPRVIRGGADDIPGVGAGRPGPDLAGTHIGLIVDDEDTRVTIGDTLRHCGATVTTYDSADAALAGLTRLAPTIFIADLLMPGLDGIAFMRRIRAEPPERGGRIPAIAITTHAEEPAATVALKVGFNECVGKPIDADALCRLVGKLAAASVVTSGGPPLDGEAEPEPPGERLTNGPASRRPSAASRGAGLVLIADDTFDTRELYDLYLTRCGFAVLTAADGEAAVQTAVESGPDVVVLDVSMPRVDGVAATKRLKEHPRTRHIPVIVVTGFPHRAAQRRALEAGADVFLTKPCLPEELEAAVRRLVGRSVNRA